METVPTLGRLARWLLLRPISLHHHLKANGIDPEAAGWRLWREGGPGRVYLLRMLLLLTIGMPGLVGGVGLLLALVGVDIDIGEMALGVAWGVAGGVAGGVAWGVAGGVAGGVAIIISYLRLPLYLFEWPWQLLSFGLQRHGGAVTLGWSPVLHHELSYLPLPALTAHILDTATRDPELARRALDACAVAPGQRRAGRRALVELRVRELNALLEARAFDDLAELRGDWLPDSDSADATLAALRETARQLRAAALTRLHGQRAQRLAAAEGQLRAVANGLLDQSGLESGPYRALVERWIAFVKHWHAETEAEGAHELPNPFRAGQPLDPQFGQELFRGRDILVSHLEAILGDASSAASIALIGPRRCGKTSLLKMLPIKLPDITTVFFDLQDHPVETPGALVAALVKTAREQARRDQRLMLPELPAGAPLEALREWLDRLEHLQGEARVLICLDEFERLETLFPNDQHALRQFMGLVRATIQHRRRVRILVSGAAPFDELGELWDDHFINLREIAIGHLAHDDVIELLTRPTADFPPEVMPAAVAEAVWCRTLGQPYLVQLYGQLILMRLNRLERRRAEVADCAAVEPEVLGQGAAYFRYIVGKANIPAAGLEYLVALAAGEAPDPGLLDRRLRRRLRRRCLITDDGGLGIPVLAAYLRRED
ncbi:hypothetical protein MARPU_12035 [Marichromatium purpuratum 984]|uniref:ORC1/DEAH AAA+ ATPase domain-containing protein n=1 Tax=Marichromatium purpuratum 984 TaxID=765910 RepID=W0E3Y1_MARPU|nr:hypothetical protein MARPU_12035 [Marichromatium purpuratum 984]